MGRAGLQPSQCCASTSRNRSDLASRRSEKIDAQVDWIHRKALSGKPAKILDLACGPGLYASRLARLGHRCVGVDFSPASIEYAREQVAGECLDCEYVHADIRTAEYGTGYGLAMLIFGEFNVFKPSDAARILSKASGALDAGGILLLEAHTHEAMREFGRRPATWYSSESGLFSESAAPLPSGEFLGRRCLRCHPTVLHR